MGTSTRPRSRPTPHARRHARLPPSSSASCLPHAHVGGGSRLTTLCHPLCSPSRSDVKPENLLSRHVGGVEIVKLADFGSAIELPPEGIAAVDPVAQGTTLYSPPEVLQGEAFACGVDVWASGITAYVLISGFFPFGTTADALAASPSFEGDGWRHVSLVAQAFIEHLLRHDPSARPSAVEAQRHAWLLHGAKAASPTTTPQEEAVEPPTTPTGAHVDEGAGAASGSPTTSSSAAAAGARRHKLKPLPPPPSTYTPAHTPGKRREPAGGVSRWPAKKRTRARAPSEPEAAHAEILPESLQILNVLWGRSLEGGALGHLPRRPHARRTRRLLESRRAPLYSSRWRGCVAPRAVAHPHTERRSQVGMA